MRAKYFVLIVAVIIVAVAWPERSAAQEGGWNAGFLLSLNRSEIRSPQVDDDQLHGFSGGGFLQRGFGTNSFANVRAELQLITKGSNNYASVSEQSARFYYLELPVLFVARIPTGGTTAPQIIAGGHVAYEVSCNFNTATTPAAPVIPGSDSGSCSDFGLETQKFDAGITAGVGVGMFDQVLVDIRVDYGLLDVGKDAALEIKNLAFMFVVGGTFRLGW